jgi:hypothetical protein
LLPSKRLVLARCRACLTAFLRSRERQKTARLRAAEASSSRGSVGKVEKNILPQQRRLQ